MGVNRRPHLTTAFIEFVAVLLGSLWAGGLAVPAAGSPAGQLTAGLAAQDRAGGAAGPGPGAAAGGQRPGPDGRLLPLLLGLLTASSLSPPACRTAAPVPAGPWPGVGAVRPRGLGPHPASAGLIPVPRRWSPAWARPLEVLLVTLGGVSSPCCC